MNINEPEDRNDFEQNRLVPALHVIHDCLSMIKYPYVIVGSTALYLQNIHLNDFPHDIDVCMLDDNPMKYKLLYRNICRRYDLGVDFLHLYDFNLEKTEMMTYDDLNIRVMKADSVIRYTIHAIGYWAERGNMNKSQKHRDNIEHLKLCHPELFVGIDV